MEEGEASPEPRSSEGSSGRGESSSESSLDIGRWSTGRDCRRDGSGSPPASRSPSGIRASSHYQARGGRERGSSSDRGLRSASHGRLRSRSRSSSPPRGGSPSGSYPRSSGRRRRSMPGSPYQRSRSRSRSQSRRRHHIRSRSPSRREDRGACRSGGGGGGQGTPPGSSRGGGGDPSTLFVGDLPPGLEAWRLRRAFEELAPVTNARVKAGKQFGFVTFRWE